MEAYKIGDLLTGNEKSHNRYDVTNSFSLVKVLNLGKNSGEIHVKVIKHLKESHYVGSVFRVSPEFFKKVSEKEFNYSLLNAAINRIEKRHTLCTK